MTRSYIFAVEAQEELVEIVRYTAQKWGAQQARVYATQIDEAAAELATGQGVYKDWNDVLAGLRVKSVGSHFVFCLVRQGEQALVLAILHQRMDLMARLKARFE